LKTVAGPWGTSTLTYDTQDNLTADTSPPSTSISIGTGNQATSATVGGTAVALTFDGRGNLKQKGSGTAATHYTFDDANLLTSIVNGGSTWEYSYDALGYRSTTASPAWNVVSVYDHTGRLLYETETANGVPDRIFQSGFEPPAVATFQNKYVYLGTHLLAVERKTGGTTQLSYQHTDALGTPVAQTDASRNLLGTSTYLPYGGLYASTGIGNLTGPGYANQYVDDTGLIYMHARYYDPQLRRFIGPDPDPVDAGTALNFNRYAYARNSPFRFYDPSGRDDEDTNPPVDDDPSGCSEAADLCPGGNPQLAGIRQLQQNIGTGVEIADKAATTVVETAAMAAIPGLGEIKEIDAAVGVVNDVRVGIAANAAKGAAAEDSVAAALGDAVAGRRVTLEASTGERSVADIVTKDGGVVEVKSGGARLSSGQKAVKADIDAGRMVTPRGQNALDAGLEPGVATPMKCYDVTRCP
jgi:RHS repeat-associated protein